MSRAGKRWLGAALLLLLGGLPSAGAEVSLSVPVGGVMPDLTFSGLADPADYGALGLPQKEGGFRLSEVSGDLLVLEFFNRLCLNCRRQAPLLQSFSQAVRKGDLAGRVRILGVGVGNRLKELREFRSQLQLSYPITEDPEFDRFLEIGDPGGTPLSLFLLRREGRWTLADAHMGVQGETEFLARSRVMLEGKAGALELASSAAGPPRRTGAATATDDDARAKALLTAVAGREVRAEPVDLPGGSRAYRALGPDGSSLGLYARVARRAPVCDLCHAIHFVLVFDLEGTVRGFEPIYVTKYGNEEWSREDTDKMRDRLTGRKMKDLEFQPDVDAVTSATMSSSLIFDEVRRSAALLGALEKR